MPRLFHSNKVMIAVFSSLSFLPVYLAQRAIFIFFPEDIIRYGMRWVLENKLGIAD